MAMETERPGPGNINPYAAPTVPADASLNEIAPVFDLTRDEVKSFVGDRDSYYWGVWRRAGTKGGLVIGFNWAACLLNMLWLLYRRMYREFWIAVGALVAASAARYALLAVTEGRAHRLGSVVNLGIAGTLGLLGNGLYLRYARRAVAVARAQEPDPERRLRLLASRGGTSMLWPLLAMAGMVSLSVFGTR